MGPPPRKEWRESWIKRWASEKSLIWGGEPLEPRGGKQVALRNISFLGHEYNANTFRGKHYAETLDQRRKEWARLHDGPPPRNLGPGVQARAYLGVDGGHAPVPQ